MLIGGTYVQPRIVKAIVDSQTGERKEVEVIKKGEEFSECYQKETQQYLKIKNEFLYKRHHQTYCLDDYTDYFISAKKGDLVKVIGIYSHYAYVIHQGEVGWIDVKCINL